MEKIVIAEFEFDTQAIQRATTENIELVKQIANLRQANRDLRKETDGLTTATDEQADQFNKNAAEIKKLNKDYTNNQKVINASSRATKELNGLLKEEIKTEQQARNNILKLTEARKAVNRETSEGRALIDGINKKIDENNDFLDKNADKYTSVKRNIGNYKEGVIEALQSVEIFGVNVGTLTDRLVEQQDSVDENGKQLTSYTSNWAALTAGIRRATAASLRFIATPIGAAIAVAAGISLAVKQWFDYNASIRDAIILTEQITGLIGEAADTARVRAESLTTVFGGDFKENLVAANVLVEEFQISYDEAFDVIQDGFVRGGAASNEFIDSLREYPTFFAQAEFSARDLSNIINTGIDLGIYNDKLPDAIKEATISLTEGTTATRDSLVNAFGATFTDDVLSRIKTGETSVRDALFEISQESDKAQLNLQQQAQLTADVFRGAGEDAGGALRIFEAVNIALSDQQKEYNQVEAQVARLAEVTTRAGIAKDNALKSDSIIALQEGFKVAGKEIEAAFFNGLSAAGEFFNKIIPIYLGIQVAGIQVFRALPTVARESFKQIITGLTSVFKGVGDLVKGIKQASVLDFSGASDTFKLARQELSDGFGELSSTGKAAFSELKDTATNTFKTVRDTVNTTNEGLAELGKRRREEAEKNKELSQEEIARLQKEAQAARAAAKAKVDAELQASKERIALFVEEGQGRNKAFSEQIKFEEELRDKRLDDLQKNLEAGRITEIKFEEESLKIKREFLEKQALLSVDNLEKEANLFEAQNKNKIDSEVLLTEAIVQEELRRIDEVEAVRLAALEARRETDLQDERDFLVAKAELEDTFQAERDAIAEEKRVQDKALAKELQELEFEEEILLLAERDASRFEVELAQIEQRRLADIQAANDKIKNEQALKTALANIELKAAQDSDAIRLAVQNEQLRGAAQVAGGLARIVGEQTAVGKAAAVAEATINTYRGANNALATLPPPASFLTAATTIATGLANVGRILGIKGAEGAANGLAAVTAGIGRVQAAKLPKGERGMTIKGRRHSSGGEPLYDRHGRGVAELEDGENMYVLNRGASRLINALSTVNEMTGGVPLSSVGYKMQDGGVIERSFGGNDALEAINNRIDRIEVINVATDTIDVATEDQLIVENANV